MTSVELEELGRWVRALQPDANGWLELFQRLHSWPPEALAEAVPLLEPVLESWPDGVREVRPEWFVEPRSPLLALARSAHLQGDELSALDWPGLPVRELSIFEAEGASVARALAGARLPHLRSLAMGEVDLPDETASALARSPLLAELESLELDAYGLTGEGLATLVRAAPRLKRLSVGMPDATLPSGLAHLPLANLEHLELRIVQLGDSELVALLDAAPKLRGLSLSMVGLGWRSLAAMAGRRLEDLALSGYCVIGGHGALGKVTTLRRLSFDRTGLDAAGCEGLARLEGLKALYIGERGLGDASARALAGGLPALRELGLTDAGVGPEGAEALARAAFAPRLDFLRLSLSPIGDRGFAALAATTRPAQLDLGYCQLTAASVAPWARSEAASRIRELNLRGNRLGPEGARAIAESPHLRGLQSLVLGSVNVGAEGARALAASPNVGGLNQFLLDGTDLGADGAAALAASPYLPERFRAWFARQVPPAPAQTGLLARLFGRR